MSIHQGGLITDTTPGRRLTPEDLAADPRISNLRPAWLADDRAWRDQLQAMTEADAKWFAAQWALAGGPEPSVDRSWVTVEWRR